MIKFFLTVGLLLTLPQAFAADATVGAFSFNSSSSGTSSGKRNLPLPWTEISIGTSQLTQTLADRHQEHPIGFHAAVQGRAGAMHFGVGFLGVTHDEQQNAGTYGQVNVGESLYMETLNAGFILGNFIIVDGGYGFAQMRRSTSNPYATPSSTENITANGMGWNLGGTIVPFRTKTASFGMTYYYFDATSNSYASDSVSGSTQTKTTSPAKIHSTGYFAGLSVLFNY